ncbi:MAG: hypothetical protein ACXAC5_03545 [Promethearchaeota archaeon]|jgi:hypothetical protein
MDQFHKHVGLLSDYSSPNVVIYNRGNSGRQFWYSDAGEVLEFRSADGAILHNYDTDHLFLI